MLLAVGTEGITSWVEARAKHAGLTPRHRADGKLLAHRGGGAFQWSAPTSLTSLDGRAECRLEDDGIHVRMGACGGRALFAARVGSTWIVSNQLALLADLVTTAGRAPSLDLDWLAASILLTPTLRAATPYEAVLAVRSNGHTLFAAGQPPRFTEATHAAITETRIEDVEGALRSVVRRHASLAPRHAVLAGGIDSCSLAALLAPVTDVLPVCIDFGEADEDRPYVEQLASFIGKPHRVIAPADAARELPPDLTVDGAPVLWPTAPHVQACLRVARDEGIRAVWMGIGGDELFDGSPRGASSLARRGRLRDAISLARDLAPPTLLGQARSVALNVAWAWLRPHLPRGLLALRGGGGSPPLRPWAGARLHACRAASLAGARGQPPPWEISRRDKVLRYLRWNHYDRVAFDRHLLEVAGGVLRIDPYLEPEIVRAVAALPDDELVRGGVPRAALREAVRGLLPENVRMRRAKASCDRAILTMFRAVPVERWRRLATPTALADLGLVEPRSFRADYDELEGDPLAHPEGWLRVWPVLACEAFVRGVAKLPGRFEGGYA